MKKYFFILLAGVVLFSCKTKNVEQPKKKEDIIPIKKVDNSAFFTTITKQPTFDALKIGSKVEVKNGKLIPRIDATFYIENNKKIWFNMYALFVNAARGVATPQGIQAYEKINKTYIDSDFRYVNKLLNVDFVDYQSLQNLILGVTFIPLEQDGFAVENMSNGFQLTTLKNQKIVVDGKIKEYKIEMNYSINHQLTRVFLQDVKTLESLEIQYSNWIEVENVKLPKNVKIIIKGNKTDEILIENTKFEFSKMDTPYSVPSNYKKVEIK